MEIRTKIVLAAAAVALSITTLNITMPRAVKAAVATLVRDQDNAARHSFTTFCTVKTPGASVNCTTPAIPAGEEFVVENVSVFGTADSANTVLEPQLTAYTSGQSYPYALDPIDDSGVQKPINAVFQGTQALRIYVDPGTSITFTAFTGRANPVQSLLVGCTISGYYVSLP